MRVVAAVFTGLFITILIVLAFALLKLQGSMFMFDFPPMCGSFVAGYIARKKGWLAGLIVSTIYSGSVLLLLMAIGHGSYNAGVVQAFLSLKFHIVLMIVVCTLCGYAGGFIRKVVDQKKTAEEK